MLKTQRMSLWWEYPHETSPEHVPRGRGDKARTTVGRPAPKNFGWPKIVQILARYLTTFDIDREYLRNGSTYRKSETRKFSKADKPARLLCIYL